MAEPTPRRAEHLPPRGRARARAVETWAFYGLFVWAGAWAAGEPSGEWAALGFAAGAVFVAIVRLTGKEGLYRVVSSLVSLARRDREQGR